MHEFGDCNDHDNGDDDMKKNNFPFSFMLKTGTATSLCVLFLFSGITLGRGWTTRVHS